VNNSSINHFSIPIPLHFFIYLYQSQCAKSQKRQSKQSHTKGLSRYFILFITIAIWISQPPGYLSDRFKAGAMKKKWWPQNRKPKRLQLKWENKTGNRDCGQSITGSNLRWGRTLDMNRKHSYSPNCGRGSEEIDKRSQWGIWRWKWKCKWKCAGRELFPRPCARRAVRLRAGIRVVKLH